MTHRFTAGAALAPLLLALVSSVLAVQASAQAVTPTGAPTREERGNLVLDGVPPHSPAMAEAVDRWMAGRGAGFRDFLPDGSILVGTRFGETEQLHRVAAPLGAREQLTFSPEPVGGALVPRGTAAPGFVFLSDRGGNENAQLTWFSLADRSQRLLTDGRVVDVAARRDGGGRGRRFEQGSGGGHASASRHQAADRPDAWACAPG